MTVIHLKVNHIPVPSSMICVVASFEDLRGRSKHLLSAKRGQRALREQAARQRGCRVGKQVLNKARGEWCGCVVALVVVV